MDGFQDFVFVLMFRRSPSASVVAMTCQYPNKYLRQNQPQQNSTSLPFNVARVKRIRKSPTARSHPRRQSTRGGAQFFRQTLNLQKLLSWVRIM